MMNSTQLDLWQEELDALPWQGQSPRVLTKGRLALFLRREPQKDDSFFADPGQFDLFLAAIRGRRRYGGAPSLLPLPRGGGSSRGG